MLELVVSLWYYYFYGQFSLSRDQQEVVLRTKSSLYGSYPTYTIEQNKDKLQLQVSPNNVHI